MSKKTLLNESQVRRFMKLATIGTLSDGFVDGLSESGYFNDITTEQEEEDPMADMEAGADMGAEEDPMADMGAEEELPMDDEAALDDEALDDAAGESLPPEVVAKVEDALAQALGAMEQSLEDAIPELDLSVEQEPSGDDMDVDADMDLGAEEELPGDEGPADDEMAGLDDMEAEAAPEDELVERIVRRVAERLRNRKGSK